MTARSDRDASVDALAAGADDYFAKPYDWELLFSRARWLLSRSATLANLRRADTAVGEGARSRAARPRSPSCARGWGAGWTRAAGWSRA